MYIVGEDRGLHLAELGQLNLQGELHIKKLHKVKSIIDAKNSNMLSKHLNHLTLSWDRWATDKEHQNDEQILEVLQPNVQQLQTLHVSEYRGVHFPQWMTSPSLRCLNSLKLVNCNFCLQLPQFGRLPSLKSLSLCKMSQVTCLNEEAYTDGVFIALKSLILENMPNLIRLSREDGENMLPSLSKL